MKKLRLIKAARILGVTFALCASIFTAISCSEIADSDIQERNSELKGTTLRFAVQDFSRTVLPGKPDSLDDFVNFKVYGIKYEESYDFYKSWEEYPAEEKEQFGESDGYESLTALQKAAIPIPAAYTNQHWRFYLTATKGENGAVYAGMSIERVYLELNRENTVKFELFYAEPGTATGKGNLEFTCNFGNTEKAKRITKASAALYAIQEDGKSAASAEKNVVVGDGTESILTEDNSLEDNPLKFTISDIPRASARTAIPEDNPLKFAISDIPAGTYRLKINFYGDSDEKYLLGQWFEVVQIAGGLTSSAKRYIDYLTAFYKVTYHINLPEGKSLSFPSEEILSEGTKLPMPKLEGYFFENWYVDENLSTTYGDELYADIELWAKWVEGTLDAPLTKDNAEAAIKSLDPSEATQDNPAKIKVTGEIDEDTIKKINYAMQDNPNAYISLDLSEANITKIEEYAFSYCSSLYELTIGKDVSSIADTAFNEAGVSKFTVSGENTVYMAKDSVLFEKEDTSPKKLVAYPRGSSSTTYEVPEGVTEIADWAFSGSRLESIKLPSTLQKIYKNTFDKCKDLSSITVAEGNTKFKVENGLLYTVDENGEKTVVCQLTSTIYSSGIPTGENLDVSDSSYITTTYYSNNYVYYKINVTKGKAYKVNWVDSLSYNDLSYINYPEGLGDCYISVYDEGFTPIKYQNDDSPKITFTAFIDAPYYIVVEFRPSSAKFGTTKCAFRVSEYSADEDDDDDEKVKPHF